MQKHNFGAGPGILPQEVLQQAAQAVLNWDNSGLSLLEFSHRTPAFEAVMDEAVDLTLELLKLPKGGPWKVLFLQGGATMQFAQVPQNLLANGGKAVYTETGVWASKAAKEAKLFGETQIIASSKDSNYTFIPKEYTIPADAKYFHITSNNTIYGTQLHNFPASPVPLVCDMSSDIFSRDFDASKFHLIYAGAQKNMGPAGTTLVVIHDDLLKTIPAKTLPTMMDYNIHVEGGSMHNTPPVFAIFVSMLTMRWVKKMGGMAAMEVRNNAKAKLLYDEIDRNSLFKGTCAVEDRSRMNVCFVLHNAELDKAFLTAAEAAGCIGLKGHRSVGGFRASLYNALPIESVQVLIDVMKDFEAKNR